MTREYHYRVDRDGRFFHDGTEIVDGITLRFFLRALTRTPDGRWLVTCQSEQNWFDADVTPFVVQRLSANRGGGIELHLAADVNEPLDPATLSTDGRDVFCQIGRARHPARFGRVALQQLTPFLSGDDGETRLVLDERAWPIRRVAR